MRLIIAIVCIASSLFIFGVRIYKGVILKQNVTGYLKRAADANTIALAARELNKAISYLEAQQMTEGYTSVLYRTPDEDVGFWYENLKASSNELSNLNNPSALERTNVLLKLRETLLDQGERTKVTAPKGLAVFPNNALWAALMTLALSLFVAGIVIIAIVFDHSKQAANHK